jgi:site-specific recombinase XerD
MNAARMAHFAVLRPQRLPLSDSRQLSENRHCTNDFDIVAHAFRRAFALASLRGGMDVYSLQRLMGHADLSVLRRYLAQTEGDLQAAHQKAGPVDRLL